MALTKAQLMTPPGGPGVQGAIKGGTGVNVSPDGTISINATQTLTKLVAGQGVTLEPASGVGDVRINVEAIGGGSIPKLAKTFFLQASAPTGWTLVTTDSDCAIRIVSGNAATGGSVAASSIWTSIPVSGSVNGSNYQVSGVSVSPASIPCSGSVSVSGSISPTSLNTGNGGAHSHSYSYTGIGGIRVYAGPNPQPSPSPGMQNMGSDPTGQGGSHTHSFSGGGSFSGNPISHSHSATASASGNISFVGTPINLAVKYVDIICAYKN